jgi:hypothetical protein
VGKADYLGLVVLLGVFVFFAHAHPIHAQDHPINTTVLRCDQGKSTIRQEIYAQSSLELSGEGKVDRKDGATRFTEVVLRPRLRVPTGTDKDRMLRILEKSEKACL